MTPTPPTAETGDLSRILRRARAATLAHKKAAPQMPSPLRIHELIEGRGEVYLGERLLTTADYWLKDVEETDKTVFPTGDRGHGEPSDSRTGQRGTFGWLRTPTKDSVLRPHVGAPMTLVLQDGRALPFTVTKVLWVDNYVVQGTVPPLAPPSA